MKTKVGVVIARFQVPSLHAGHVAVIDKAKAESERVVVLLGCSELDGRTAENPMFFMQRAEMLKIDARVSVEHILPLANSQSNREWTKLVDSIIYSLFPSADATIYIGRNSVVKSCYTGRANICVVDEISNTSGTKIRSAIKSQNGPGFVLGQVFALQYQFPHTYPCVDVAVQNIITDEVLLIQRGDTGAWCLPGGFVDPTDQNLEAAAKRELQEETSLTCEGVPQYVSSRIIDDWRYRGRDKIMSSLFTVPYSFGRPELTNEAIDHKWVQLLECERIISKCHAPFIEDLIRYNANKVRTLL
jgi:bifunctional NMN adenylyltransferase/nudix hydrolase